MRERWQEATKRAEVGLELAVKACFCVVTVLLGVASYQGRTALETLADHSVRIVRTETTQQHQAEELSELRAHLVAHNPPNWVKDALIEIRTDLRDLRRRIP